MNILFTSVGRRSYLIKYFKKALGNKGEIHVANSSELSPAFQIADFSVVTPLIYDDDYIPFLIRYCIENDIQAIISLFDIDLPILSKNKKLFEDIGVTVVVSNPEVIDICNDKWKTYIYLLKNGFDVPKTFTNLNDAITAVQEGKINYPMIIKPRWGMGSIAVFEAENENELRIFYDKTKRNIQKTYLKYESSEDIEKSVIIQEKLNGQEHGLDIINDLSGNYQTTICKVKYAMRSGETDSAITIDSLVLKNIGQRLSHSLRHIGNLDCDVFLVGDKPYVLEMNARFGGGYPFSHMAGVNLPKAIVAWLMNENPDSSLLKERFNVMSQKDIGMVRLYSKSNVRIVPVSDETRIYDAISLLEGYLVPSLKQRGVNIMEYAKKLTQFGKVWLVLDEGENIHGIVASYNNDQINYEAYVSFLAVDTEYRGLNLGEKLFHIVEKEALANGMKIIKVEVWKNNINAIKLYYRLGYEITEESTEDSFFMKKIIAQPVDNATIWKYH